MKQPRASSFVASVATAQSAMSAGTGVQKRPAFVGAMPAQLYQFLYCHCSM